MHDKGIENLLRYKRGTHQGCPKNKNKGEKVSDFERKPIRRGNELHGDFM